MSAKFPKENKENISQIVYRFNKCRCTNKHDYTFAVIRENCTKQDFEECKYSYESKGVTKCYCGSNSSSTFISSFCLRLAIWLIYVMETLCISTDEFNPYDLDSFFNDYLKSLPVDDFWVFRDNIVKIWLDNP